MAMSNKQCHSKYIVWHIDANHTYK